LPHVDPSWLFRMKLISAKLQSHNKVVLHFDGTPQLLDADAIAFTPPRRILALEQLEDTCVVLTEDFDLTRNFTVLVHGFGYLPVLPDGVFDAFLPDARPGCVVENGRRVLRLFAPRATSVHARFFRDLDDEIGTLYELQRDEHGMWQLSVEADPNDRSYCFHVSGPQGSGDVFDEAVPIADPYARIVVTKNTHRHEARALLADTAPFDWEDDRPVAVDPRDLVIYEAHVKDLTAHPSAGIEPALAGTYLGMTVDDAPGGLAHLRRLGVNAVELLPVQHFASLEPPYRQPTEEGFFNTWNPYARNHWGYMTSYFFAPEPTYATGSVATPGAWNDTAGRQAVECKRMVKALHRAGLAVIMDVVYNHTSQYDLQPLRSIDTKYYYRVDAEGKREGRSGCGNDLHTARPMARRLIIDSVLHWMTEYHVDGFRFDLATMIDEDTFRALIEAARAINPDVILIAEPWGGGQYDLHRFSRLGMSAWNDVFRDGVRGYNPHNAPGFIFGTWGSRSSEDFGLWVFGSVSEKGGPFLDAAHSVNYLSAHDGYTLGDFIRIACGRIGEHTRVDDVESFVRLTDRELRIARLAALMLLTSQGAVMLEQGQEFARAKVIAERGLPGTTPGMIDHNSYEKDDETNWLNYGHVAVNASLVDYYAGLIGIRRRFASLRRAARSRYRFLSADVGIASGFIIAAHGGEPDLAVLINANSHQAARYALPASRWRVHADADRASSDGVADHQGDTIVVPPETGVILVSTDQ
jgi:pullulanase